MEPSAAPLAPAAGPLVDWLPGLADVALAAPATAGLSRQRSTVTRDLATYRATLVRQYAAMDRLVAATKAVEAQLDQQIAAWNNQRDN
jgi:hypothetical protein